MRIRRAVAGDCDQIVNIAKSIKINYSPQNNGFLVYVLSPKEYLSRIRASRYFYVAEDGDEIKGFLMCYDSNTIVDLRKKLEHEDGVISFLLGQKKPFVFGDQIGVRPSNQRSNTGRSMLETLFKDMKNSKVNTCYVAILHEPVRNRASIRFCSSLGFKVVGEVTNMDEHVWGVYRKELQA
ncbi:MAG: GNAT family N-acetyltransferase [Candidatus Pacearchaeota archaeon]|jgi:predicted GNAT superfamily acetyltransferase